MLIYDEATGQWYEDGSDVPEMPPQDLDEQLQSVSARYRGHSPSLSDEAINNRQRILAELDAFDAAQQPVYAPYEPRQENPDAPLIEGYGEKMAIKRPGQATVNEWGEEVSPEYVADVEAKVSGRERIPQKPPTEEQLSDFDQFNKIMADLAPDIEKAARGEADELADREQRARLGDPVHQSLMDPKVRTYHEDAIRKVWNNAYQRVKDLETRKHTEFAKMYVKEQKASQKSAAAAEKERVKEAEKKEAERLKKEKPEYTPKQALSRLSAIDSTLVRLRSAEAVDANMANVNPMLAPLMNVKDPEAIKQAIESLKREREYVEKFAPAREQKKEEKVEPPEAEAPAKYKSAEEVRKAYKDGKIKRDEATDILRKDFGMK